MILHVSIKVSVITLGKILTAILLTFMMFLLTLQKIIADFDQGTKIIYEPGAYKPWRGYYFLSTS